MSVPRSWRWRILMAGIAVAVAGCDGSTVAGAPSAPQASVSSRQTSRVPVPPSVSAPVPSPAPPAAADGTDTAACSDGRCEVRVSVSAQLPVPVGTKVKALHIVTINADGVTFAGQDIGNFHGGTCTGNCSSSGTDDGFQLTLGAGSSGTENNLAMTVVSLSGASAVVRLDPV